MLRRQLIAAAAGLLACSAIPAQSLSPGEALDRYLAGTHATQSACAGRSFSVQIDASLPKLKKHGTMRGVKLLSETGHVAYRGLQFTGDKLIKTDVIARFLSQDADLQERHNDAAVDRTNYSFTYLRTADYNGMPAFVYHLKPLKKRAGLFDGELWLDAAHSTALRLWGDFVKSPSLFIRSFRFVEDYQGESACTQPARLLLTAYTRIAGPMEMSEWLQFLPSEPASGLDQSR